MKRAEEFNIPVVFVIGDTNTTSTKHTCRSLFVQYDDSYKHLVFKTILFCKWAVDVEGWDYLFKCDDDTYINIDKLVKFNTGGYDYIGNEWKSGVEYGQDGAGCLLSRRAAEIVADGFESIKIDIQQLDIIDYQKIK